MVWRAAGLERGVIGKAAPRRIIRTGRSEVGFPDRTHRIFRTNYPAVCRGCGFRIETPEVLPQRGRLLIAVAGGDGDALAARRAAAAQHGCAGFGLHARPESVRF